MSDSLSGNDGVSAEIVEAIENSQCDPSEETMSAVASGDHSLSATLLSRIINTVPKAFQAKEVELVETADYLGGTMADDDVIDYLERNEAVTVDAATLLSDEEAVAMDEDNRVMTAREVAMADDRFGDNQVVSLRGPETDALEVTREFEETAHSANNFKGVVGNAGGEVVISVWDNEIQPSVGDVVIVGKALATQVGGSAQLKINNSSVVKCYSGEEAPSVDTDAANDIDATGVVPESFDASGQSGVRTVDAESDNHRVVQDPDEFGGIAVEVPYLQVPVRFDGGDDSNDYTESVVLKKDSLAKAADMDAADMQDKVQAGFADMVATKAANELQGQRLHIEGASLADIHVDAVERVADDADDVDVIPLFA